MEQNGVKNTPNMQEATNTFSHFNSAEYTKAEESVYIMGALREEHVRVHLQDQKLLKSLNDFNPHT